MPRDRAAEVAAIRHHVGGLPALLIVLVLLAVTVILAPMQARIAELRTEVDDVVEPAADLVAEAHFLLARETSALRGYLITEDSAYLGQYTSFRDREREIHLAVEALAPGLPREAAAAVRQIRILSEQWHSRLQVDEIADSEASMEATIVLLEQDLYRQTLEAAAAATVTLRRFTRERQARIDDVERNARLVYALLFLLASLVAVSTAILMARVRSLAREADSRRAEIEVAMRTTERAIAARSDLIRGFTHDVKNPLGVADGYAELLEMGLRGDLAPPQLEMLSRIRASIRGATEIIEELLDLNRLESGGLQVRRERVDLHALVGDLVNQHSGAATTAGVELRLHPAAEAAAVPPVYTDPDRVRQILQNLISNAIKYTPPPGRVDVRVDISGDGAAGDRARVVVTDTGVGIPAGEQDRVFDEFHRVPGAGAAGHGLGLAISRRIARLLGGDVTLRSDPGAGSTFELVLPLRHETGG